MSEENKTPLLEVKDLKKWFPAKSSPFSKEKVFIKAVDGVSFTLNAGETLGVVGESGCGKSTMGRSVLRLLEPTDGQVLFEGKDYTALKSSELAKSRSDLQIIFQDPYASLDPKMKVQDIIAEGIRAHGLAKSEKEIKERVNELLVTVGLDAQYGERYIHEFSGGQRQRIGIARALTVQPKLIIADEPVSALDVSIQAQVLNLLQQLQKDFNLTYLFISHDLSVVEMISDRIGVMYLGTIVETAPKKELYANPRHPYTRALLSAVPIPDPEVKKERITLKGDLPSPSNPPSGCLFHTRCPHCTEKCKTQVPTPVEIAPGHIVKCHYPKLTE